MKFNMLKWDHVFLKPILCQFLRNVFMLIVLDILLGKKNRALPRTPC